MWALGLLLSTTTATLAQTKPFLLGAEWQDGASKAVKDLFWETGCNFARLTGGGYGWIADAHKHALQELGDHGVRVLLQLGSHYPDGKYFDLKDAYFVDQNGKTGVPSRQSWAVEYDGQSWPQYSYANARFQSDLEKDFTAYFKSLGPFNNVEAIMVHNEPGTFWLDNRIFDYNPSSIEYFRKWLPIQYSSISALNKIWGSSFGRFDETDPPHALPTAATLPAWMDWRRSNMAVIGDFLDRERSFTRALFPSMPVTTNLAGPIDNWFPIRVADNYRFTQGMDIAAIDIYPGAEWSSCFAPGYGVDMTRGAAKGKEVYVAECESYDPEHFPKLNDEQRAARLVTDLWTYIGHGANGVLVWTLNSAGGFRLTSGEFNARMRVMRDTAYASKLLNLGDFKKPPRKVALVVDRDSYLLVAPNLGPRAWADMVSRSDLGMYGALRQANIETDVISADMVRSGAASVYKALVMASTYTMDEALASQIKKFVQNGGLVIANCSIASCDRWGRPSATCPSFGLDRVFGCRITPQNIKGYPRIHDESHSFAGSGAYSLSGKEFDVVARFDNNRPAAVRHRFGKGRGYLIASDASLANSTGQNRGLSMMLWKWLRSAGIKPEANAFAGNSFLDLSRLVDSKGNELIIATKPPNRSEPVEETKGIHAFPGTEPSNREFLFEPAFDVQGDMYCGPRAMTMGQFSPSFTETYLVFLKAKDHAPLISIETNRMWPPDSAATVKATIYNPCPRPLSGTFELAVPGDWRAGKGRTVSVKPFGKTVLKVNIRSGGLSPRAVIKPILVTKGGKVEGMPFDLVISRN